ncbi:hypothetical protein HRbin36_01666 [bacterium HR36]|nr:hypothetical protein HRbin36_01666 [bacterium HR36]
MARKSLRLKHSLFLSATLTLVPMHLQADPPAIYSDNSARVYATTGSAPTLGVPRKLNSARSDANGTSYAQVRLGIPKRASVPKERGDQEANVRGSVMQNDAVEPTCFWPHHPHPWLQPPATSGPILVAPANPIIISGSSVDCCDGIGPCASVGLGCEPCPSPCPPLCTPICPLGEPCASPGWTWGWANCPPADYRGAPFAIYTDLEYLAWWMKSMPIPPLITTSNANDLGVLGRPSTQVLLGESLEHDAFSGGRFTLGWWFDPCRVWAIEGTFFFLAEETRRDLFSSSGIPILARPFFNAQTGQEDSELIANPPLPGLFPLAGQADVALRSRLIGFELNFVRSWLYGVNPAWHKQYNLDFVFGYRYMQLRESLGIHEDLLVPEDSDGIPAGTRFLIDDLFTTRNSFNGGQIGLRGELRWGGWFLDGRAKVAFGNTSQTVFIDGNTTIITPGVGTVSGPGGLMALPTNMGRFHRDTFSVMPEFGGNLGYYITPYIKIYVGYTFIGWTNVVRPGNVVDREVNPSQLPPGGVLVGPARPAFRFRDGDFWVQGINIGLEMRY